MKTDREVEQGQYLFEMLTVHAQRAVSVNPPPGYFFLSSAPCGESPRVLVTWRKSRGENDPGPAPPVTAAPILHALPKPKPAKKASKRARGRR